VKGKGYLVPGEGEDGLGARRDGRHALQVPREPSRRTAGLVQVQVPVAPCTTPPSPHKKRKEKKTSEKAGAGEHQREKRQGDVTGGHEVVAVVWTEPGVPRGGVHRLWRSERRAALDLALELWSTGRHREIQVEQGEVVIDRRRHQFALQHTPGCQC